MKTSLITAFFAVSLPFTAIAADKAGPSGGRLLTGLDPHAEFFINANKKIEIHFVDAANKVVAPAEQVVSVIMGDRSAPTKLAFVREGDKLVSDKSVPDGNNLPTVVQIRAKEGAKAVNEKFNLNLDKCPTCEHSEYACICAHADEKK